MAIKGITDKLRYQRAGKIYLGIKIKTERVCKCARNEKGQKKNPDKDCALCLGTGYVYRPHETDYFVLKETQVPELLELYDPKPKKLNIMLPRAWELEQIFPQNLKLYGAGGLKCWGDGSQASFINPETKALDVRKCPCEMLESGRCSARAILSFRISELENSMLVYQITTGSYNSILNINSALRDLMWFSLSNRVDISDIRLNLWRAPALTQRLDDKSGKVAKSTHYPMFLDLDPDYYESWKDVISKALPIPKSRQETPQLPAADVAEDDLAYVDEETTEEEIEKEEETRVDPPKKDAQKKKKSVKTIEEEFIPGTVKESHDEALKKAQEKQEKMDKEADEVMKDIEGDGAFDPEQIDETFKKTEQKISERDELQKKLNVLIHQCKGLGVKLTKEELEELKLIRTNEDYKKMIERFDSRLKMRREYIARFGHESVAKEGEHKEDKKEE
jgi:hypothetical protein